MKNNNDTFEIKYLFHGTAGSVAQKIVEDGLKPQSITGVKKHWPKIPGVHKDMVHLTTCMASSYGLEDATRRNETKFGMVCIDLTRLEADKLYPDPLHVLQSRDLALPGSKEQRRDYVWIRDNIELFKDKWQDSLQSIGCCCYKGTIVPSAMTQAVLVEIEKHRDLVHQSCNPPGNALGYACDQRRATVLNSILFGNYGEWTVWEDWVALWNLELFSKDQLKKFEKLWKPLLSHYKPERLTIKGHGDARTAKKSKKAGKGTKTRISHSPTIPAGPSQSQGSSAAEWEAIFKENDVST